MNDPEELDLEQMFGRPGGTYALRVRGESMIGDHLCDGDYVIIERRPEAKDGEIAVVQINESEATLRKWRPQGDGSVFLETSNPDVPGRSYRPEQLRVLGVMIGVLRSYSPA